MEYFKRECAGLLRQAKALFGDLVINAYVCTYDCRDTTDTKKRIEQAERDWDVDEGEMLTYHSSEIILTFVNGNSICFSNSEWAQMEKIDIGKIPSI